MMLTGRYSGRSDGLHLQVIGLGAACRVECLAGLLVGEVGDGVVIDMVKRNGSVPTARRLGGGDT